MDAVVEALGALGAAAGILFIIVVLVAIWPLFTALTLNVVAGLGLSFWQVVGIGWFAGAIATTG